MTGDQPNSHSTKSYENIRKTALSKQTKPMNFPWVMKSISSYSINNKTDSHQFDNNNFDCQVAITQHSLSLSLIHSTTSNNLNNFSYLQD